LLALYRDHPDADLHGATAWALRQWGLKKELAAIDRQLASSERKRPEDAHPPVAYNTGSSGNTAGAPTWYVNGQGQTMVVIPGPVEFPMGSPAAEKERRPDETRHQHRIGRTFAMGSTLVTVEQFKRFNPKFNFVEMHRAPEPDCPILGIVFYEAAEYCNWLSKQEGIPEDQWCYLPNKDVKYEEGMKLAPNCLARTGYRLPTEVEWEYCCRAGAVTPRYYGETEELLRHYGWYFANAQERSWPVGSKKPNDFGLFDMHGNVYTWCNNQLLSYRIRSGPRYFFGARGPFELANWVAQANGVTGLFPPVGDLGTQHVQLSDVELTSEDLTDIPVVDDRIEIAIRGGAYSHKPVNLRCAVRNWNRPSTRANALGLRVARTLP
jgi:formylglycine-generating enzyme required for sulfatase activity